MIWTTYDDDDIGRELFLDKKQPNIHTTHTRMHALLIILFLHDKAAMAK